MNLIFLREQERSGAQAFKALKFSRHQFLYREHDRCLLLAVERVKYSTLNRFKKSMLD